MEKNMRTLYFNFKLLIKGNRPIVYPVNLPDIKIAIFNINYS
jgi:hypothetical protein